MRGDDSYRDLPDGYAVKNLVDGAWHEVHSPVRGVVDLRSPGERGVYVSGMPVSAVDLGEVLAALRAAPGDAGRHDPESNAARARAGAHALRVQDAMVRARLLDAVDGWAALLADASRVIERTEEGTLARPPEGLSCLVLVVRCPSTARVYALRVPNDMQTVHDARTWVMDGLSPEVET